MCKGILCQRFSSKYSGMNMPPFDAEHWPWPNNVYVIFTLGQVRVFPSGMKIFSAAAMKQ